MFEPSVRQLPIQECCHIIVGVWWHSVTLQNQHLVYLKVAGALTTVAVCHV